MTTPRRIRFRNRKSNSIQNVPSISIPSQVFGNTQSINAILPPRVPTPLPRMSGKDKMEKLRKYKGNMFTFRYILAHILNEQKKQESKGKNNDYSLVAIMKEEHDAREYYGKKNQHMSLGKETRNENVEFETHLIHVDFQNPEGYRELNDLCIASIKVLMTDNTLDSKTLNAIKYFKSNCAKKANKRLMRHFDNQCTVGVSVFEYNGDEQTIKTMCLKAYDDLGLQHQAQFIILFVGTIFVLVILGKLSKTL
ncbi:unnamed protein product [Caenorhabditis bovis]|uniref:Uncharacterized protein n=1 Tax=Caenorhabditis bovis TaxID=2654633 RepID=A0A8S1EGA6_9PELO|nr:unnamed protein product [Caenorhabditis bovis]